MRRHHLLAAAALACFACARSELTGFPQGTHPSSGSSGSGHSASASSGTGTETTGTSGTSSVGTTGTVGTVGTVGTIGTTTGTTTGGLPICAPCVDGSQCASGFCNTVTGPGPFCDDPNWCSNDSVCAPVTTCDFRTGACICPPQSTTGTVGTVGTTGGTGGECAPCQQDVDCAPGGYCVPDPLSGQSECSAPCGPGDTCSDPNSTCFHLRGRSGCFPSSFTCSGNTTGNFTTGTSGTFSTSTGTTGTFTTGTSGTTGFGECAPCSRDTDCVPGGYCLVRNAGPPFCTVPCINGGCLDPNATCEQIFNGTTSVFGCVPNGGCPGTTGTSGTIGTIGTTTTGTSGTFSTGTSGTSGTTSSGTCQSCDAAHNCSVGRFCVNLSDGTESCSLGCTANGGCANPGWTCEPIPNGGLACVPGPGICAVQDCRTLGCSWGETCQSYNTANGSTAYVCGCIDATGNPTSDCSGNPSGATVCDYNTGHCRLPEDYEPCNGPGSAPACASGYVCEPNPGGAGYCLQKCATTAGCSLSYTRCTSAGTCEYDLCGGPNPSDAGYYGPCTRLDAGDGTCEPIPDADGGIFGLCVGNGSVPVGGACEGFGALGSGGCASDELCLNAANSTRYPDGGIAQQCYQVCNAAPGSIGAPECLGPVTCDTFGGTEPGLNPGICYP
ncbi:MAG: hypothetical protein JST54_07930 [Deltaproteobacteria bacterium]|nr:hypothetical protein [Deltaproteobacteria bacterium]